MRTVPDVDTVITVLYSYAFFCVPYTFAVGLAFGYYTANKPPVSLPSSLPRLIQLMGFIPVVGVLIILVGLWIMSSGGVAHISKTSFADLFDPSNANFTFDTYRYYSSRIQITPQGKAFRALVAQLTALACPAYMLYCLSKRVRDRRKIAMIVEGFNVK